MALVYGHGDVHHFSSVRISWLPLHTGKSSSVARFFQNEGFVVFLHLLSRIPHNLKFPEPPSKSICANHAGRARAERCCLCRGKC